MNVHNEPFVLLISPSTTISTGSTSYLYKNIFLLRKVEQGEQVEQVEQGLVDKKLIIKQYREGKYRDYNDKAAASHKIVAVIVIFE